MANGAFQLAMEGIDMEHTYGEVSAEYDIPKSSFKKQCHWKN